MKFLRTVSTQRLLAILAGLIIAVAGGTAIAVAATGRAGAAARAARRRRSTRPPPRPTVSGITRADHFTNNLIDSDRHPGHATRS